jgi:hypothetical protein
MRKSRLVPLLLAAPWFFAAPAYAGVQAGDTEIGVFASIQSDNENDSSTITMSGNIGRFFTDNLEVKGGFTMSAASDADSNGFASMDFGGGADLALGGATQKFVPYVGGLLNLTVESLTTPSYDASGVGLTLDLHAGMKFFMTERSSLDLQLRQVSGTVTLSDSAGNETDVDINRTGLFVGINVYI